KAAVLDGVLVADHAGPRDAQRAGERTGQTAGRDQRAEHGGWLEPPEQIVGLDPAAGSLGLLRTAWVGGDGRVVGVSICGSDLGWGHAGHVRRAGRRLGISAIRRNRFARGGPRGRPRPAPAPTLL